MRLSIVIPVYNAEKTIESLCNTLIDLYGTRYVLEIVLVNDNSQDSTHLICRRLNERYPSMITYVRLSRNFGEHSAVMAGLNQATGDLCVIMDDDFQNPPEEVSRLVEEIQAGGFDVVYTQYPKKQDSFFRNFGSCFNDRMANLILRKPADLYLSSFKIVDRFLVDEIVKYTGPDPYIDAIILRTTSNIGKITVRHDKRKAGESGYTFSKLISLWGNMMVGYSLFPLRLLGFMGLLMTLAGAYMVFVTLANILSPNKPPTEYEVSMSVALLTRGVLLTSFSVVGEYVGRIFLSLNRDPQFVMREKFMAQRKPSVVSGIKERKGSEISSVSPAGR